MHLHPRDAEFEIYASYIEGQEEAEQLAIYKELCEHLRKMGCDQRLNMAAMAIEVVWMDGLISAAKSAATN